MERPWQNPANGSATSPDAHRRARRPATGPTSGTGPATPQRRPPARQPSSSALWRVLAAVAVGAFWGASLTLPLAARRVDTLTLLTTDLLRELAETENELARLQRHPPATVVILEVRLELADGQGARLPQVTELVLRRQLDPLAQRLVGEEVEALSPAVVRDLFHGRILPVENHLYRLRVVSLVLGPRTLIQLQVTPAAPAAPSP